MRQFLTRHPIEYTVGLGGDAAAAKYKLESYPVTIVFDRTGKEVKRYDESLTESDLQSVIQKAL